MHKGKVLLVDDVTDAVEEYQRALRRAKYAVETASSGEGGWEKCQQTRYAVVVTDWRMGDLSGLDLYLKIKATYPTTEVIVVTAFEEIKREVLNDSRFDELVYLLKPVEDLDLLLDKVKRAMERVQQRHPKPLLITEGKTDWKHLKAALRWLQVRGQAPVAALAFQEYEEEMGSRELEKHCTYIARTPQPRLMIHLFDRDEPDVCRRVARDYGKASESYKNWGNNVYSLILPVPAHRQETPDVCIELYYTDEEIKRCDANGRRLYLGEEFKKESGRHIEDGSINCSELNKRGIAGKLIENRVFNERDENIALPKSDFAQSVLDEVENFNDFDFTAFSAVFNLIEQIIRDASGQVG